MTTIETALENVRETFNFSVDKFPLSGPDGMKTPFYGLFRSDSMQAVGNPVRKRYTPHTVDDVLALCEAGAEAFEGEMCIRAHWNDGHYVSLAPSLEYRKTIFETNDNIFPRVLIRAGYDGKCFQASCGYYRDACKNMSILKSAGNETSVKFRHTYSLRSKMSELVKEFGKLRTGWDKVVSTVETMQSREVNLSDYLAAIYGNPEVFTSKREKTNHENRTSDILRRVIREQSATGRARMNPENMIVSAWEAYNAVQGYVQHDARRNGKVGKFDRMLLALNDKSVQLAETLALAS